jgi:CheY-like chemotaxis protein
MKKLNCILLVDDNDADNEFHQIIIERTGVAENIRIAENGEKALNYLKDPNQLVPELIFLDINMPRMNGWEFLARYKELGIKARQIIIVMLTTSANPDDIQRAQQMAEVNGFKTKPLTRDMLLEIMDAYFSSEAR